MSVRYLLIAFLFVFSQITFSQYTEKIIDYSSRVVQGGSSASVPVGYSHDNHGPYTAYDKIWIFYSNGQNAVWRTKQVGAPESEWSAANIIFPVSNSSHFNVAFDGRYFHFIRSVGGELRYRRGEVQPDGSIQFNSEVTAYSDPIWQLRTVEGVTPRHFSIAVDHEGKIWIALKVADGDDPSSNFKPIATSSVADDGGWQTREGFPVDLVVAYDARGYGRAPNVAEIAPGAILFTWNHDRRSEPRGLRARLWQNGSLGGIEDTGLPRTSSTASLVVPQSGIAMLNSQSEVARRNQDGSWNRVDPAEMNNVLFNVLTEHNGKVRLWDISGDIIRFRETPDNGTSWGPLTTKWGSTGVSIYQMSGTHAHGSQGSHHSIIWSSGTGPYDIHMGIEGTIPHPDAPALVFPPDGTEDIEEEDIIFEWRSIDIAYSYDVQVAKNSEFTSLVVNETVVSDTTLQISGLDMNVLYYWRVRAVTEGGAKSDWSSVWTFGTLGIAPAPVLVLPVNGAQNQSTTIDFTWNRAPGTANYQLQIATVSDFSATFADVQSIQDTTIRVSGLDHERTYYWRVRARNELGNGDWSQIWNFTTIKAVPPAPNLVSPENGAADVLTTLEIAWEETPTATSYRVQVSEVAGFTSTVVNEVVTNISYEVKDLDHATTYYWRVNAANEGGTGNWSSIWNFTTIIERPEVPVLISPVIGEDSVSTFPVLGWDGSLRAEAYRVQVATDSQFINLVFDKANIDSTQYTFTEELNEFSTYYWRVNAANIGGISDWSEVSHFITDQAVPAAPVLVRPDDGTTEVEDATLLWNSVPSATSYRIQISEDIDFSTTAVDKDDITNTFYTATNLEKWTQYYWRVRGISRVGQGYWSEVRSFETGDIVSVELVESRVPTEFALAQNYPNPFNPITTIRFALPSEANVHLEIYNMLGQRVTTIIDGEHYTPGIYEAVWDARDAAGNEVSSGVYIYRISAGDYVEIKKMILTR